MSELANFRAQKDTFFAQHEQSPLTPEQKEKFTGLAYFPENASLRLLLEVDEFPEREEIQVQTSTGDVRTYVRFGRIQFDVDGEPVSLTIYEAGYGYFLPFIDSLANQETYGAGRYLEPEELPDGKFMVDFNQAYNPYCAYNERWNCPLTPWENRLSVPIRAGEKTPPAEWAGHE